MSFLHWGDHARLKTYSSTTRSDGRSTIKLEIETSDTFELSSMLRQLAQITAEQKEADRVAAADARAAAAAKRRCRPAAKSGKAAIELEPNEPTLLLEDRRDRR